MKIKIIIFFLFAYFTPPLVFAANQVVHYQPAVVTLNGIIKVRKFPAPPKNECIGDKEEIYRYLDLDRPIDVVPQKIDNEAKNELQKDVKIVHIVKIEDYNADSDAFDRVIDPIRSNWADKFIGKHVRVTGKLYSRIARVVMLAEHFEEVKNNES